MTMAAPYAEKVPPGFGWRDAALWSGAAALVVAAHAAVGWYAYSRAPEPFASDPPASAVMIDLAPMAVAPEAVPLDQADPVDSVASETVEETAEPLEEVQPETVEAEPVEQEVAQPVTAEAPEPAITTSDSAICFIGTIILADSCNSGSCPDRLRCNIPRQT